VRGVRRVLPGPGVREVRHTALLLIIGLGWLGLSVLTVWLLGRWFKWLRGDS